MRRIDIVDALTCRRQHKNMTTKNISVHTSNNIVTREGPSKKTLKTFLTKYNLSKNVCHSFFPLETEIYYSNNTLSPKVETVRKKQKFTKGEWPPGMFKNALEINAQGKGMGGCCLPILME